MKDRTSGYARASGLLSMSYLVSMSNGTHAHARKAIEETWDSVGGGIRGGAGVRVRARARGRVGSRLR